MKKYTAPKAQISELMQNEYIATLSGTGSGSGSIDTKPDKDVIPGVY